MFKKIARLFRKITQCNFDIHWRMKYDSGLAMDIGRAGTCQDCGYRVKEIVWPRTPPYKPAKCNSCKKGYNGTFGRGYQPCGCPHADKLNPVPPN